jgi:hypothetical protein
MNDLKMINFASFPYSLLILKLRSSNCGPTFLSACHSCLMIGTFCFLFVVIKGIKVRDLQVASTTFGFSKRRVRYVDWLQ